MNKNLVLIILIFSAFVTIIHASIVYFNLEPRIAGYAVLDFTEDSWNTSIIIDQGLVKIDNNAIYSKTKYNQTTVEFRAKFTDDISKYGSWLVGGFADDAEFNMHEKAVFYIDADFMKAFVSDGAEISWCDPIVNYNWQEFHNFRVEVTDKTKFYVDDLEVCSINKIPNKELPIAVNENSIKDGISMLLESIKVIS